MVLRRSTGRLINNVRALLKSLFLVIWATHGSLSIADSHPLRISNQLPIMNGSGLAKAVPAALLSDGQSQLSIDLHLQSNASDSASEIETLLIDGESRSINLLWSKAIAPRWQVGLDISWLQHSPGSFDTAIDSWHDFFGLSSGDRPMFQPDQLQFDYTSLGAVGFNQRIDQRVSGLSDLRLNLSYQLDPKLGIESSAHVFANLPTGKNHAAIGSDKTDLGLQFAFAPAEAKKVSWHANLGYLFIGDDQLFGIKTKSGTWVSSLGAHWQFNSRWRASAQLDGHGSIFKSQIPELSHSAWQLGLGAQYSVSKKHSMQLFFTEDVTVNRSADFAIGLNWSIRH